MNGFMNLDGYVHKFCEFFSHHIAEQQSKPKRGKDLLVVAVSVSGNVGSTRHDRVLEAIFNVLGVSPAHAHLLTTAAHRADCTLPECGQCCWLLEMQQRGQAKVCLGGWCCQSEHFETSRHVYGLHCVWNGDCSYDHRLASNDAF